MENLRKSGVILPITALQGGYGIGDFGQNAEGFAAFIARMGFSVWQVLPLTASGLGNSPYSGVSAFAGNALLIDVERFNESLITSEEKKANRYYGQPYRVDYPFAKKNKRALLSLAYSRLNDEYKAEIAAFAAKNEYWLPDYALYSALKDKFNGLPFFQWDDKYKFRDNAALDAAKTELAYEIGYYEFEQFSFFEEWSDLKAKTNKHGVSFFGDMPIYVAHDSCDVWAHPELFELNADLSCKSVAGVPPDYFAEDGQLWGNPLYRWRIMSRDGYDWWVRRILHNLSLYDTLRIDHFRGLCEFWAVDASETTAKNGKWKKGCGMGLWRALKKVCPNPDIVAEDLGIIDDKVRKYLDKTGFPGMRVFQFAFDGTKNNPHLPYNYPLNTVAYTATHDNDTTLGWIYNTDKGTRTTVLDYLEVSEGWGVGGGSCKTTRAAAKEILASSAKLAILPLQDLSGYGSDTRTNIPGTPEGNWEFRCTQAAMDEIDTKYFRDLNEKYGRTNL
ncbi:MAG: 4-alpha-glucanotransferase [Christensenellaceae bacterium]|jgi:4-alpha-glucanotransferase|nr:4-alpha-glucanotransferase [Christensenellaceae bacterium]